MKHASMFGISPDNTRKSGDEFRKRVLEEHDFDFYHRFLDAIETRTLEKAL